MTLILAIETSTKVCSTALFKDDKLVGYKEEGGAFNHAERLNLFIQELLKKHELSFTDLNAIAVSKGPGSYTGLRIGVATAKGLCYALGIPLIAVSTLKSMAAQALTQSELTPSANTLLCPMIDARRNEVYTALFNAQLETIKPIAAEIIEDANVFDQWTDQKQLYYFGDGAEKCQSTLQTEKRCHYLNITECCPSARFMGNVAYQKWQQQAFEDVAYFEPFYLKAFMATTPKKLL
jgi:tRNA threonylcarbamoyladenosine biosynthesis protein TsaB